MHRPGLWRPGVCRERLNADNIQIIDPQQGYTTPANAQVSVAMARTPGYCFVNANKAMSVVRAKLTPADPQPTTWHPGELDLRSLIKPTDRDGSPSQRLCWSIRLLYVVLQHSTDGTLSTVSPGEFGH